MKIKTALHLIVNRGHQVQRSCKLLGIARSSFYAAKIEKISSESSQRSEIKGKIREIFFDNKKRYGSPRITSELRDLGYIVGENKVAKLMQEMGLKASQKASFRPQTTVNDPNSRKAERIFKVCETKPEKPNQYWGSDLTYLPCFGNFLYLVVFIDLFSRKVKSWELSTTMHAHHTRTAFLNAVKSTRGSLEGLVTHSDQGVQYCWGEYQETLNLLSVTQSMSRKGNCYDNAFVESFFATLKRELELKNCKNIYEVKEEIEKYIDWYNTKRKHSSLGQISPEKFEKKYEALSA